MTVEFVARHAAHQAAAAAQDRNTEICLGHMFFPVLSVPFPSFSFAFEVALKYSYGFKGALLSRPAGDNDICFATSNHQTRSLSRSKYTKYACVYGRTPSSNAFLVY